MLLLNSDRKQSIGLSLVLAHIYVKLSVRYVDPCALYRAIDLWRLSCPILISE